MRLLASLFILCLTPVLGHGMTVKVRLTLDKVQHYKQMDKNTLSKLSSTMTGDIEVKLTDGDIIMTHVKKELNLSEAVNQRDEIKTLDKKTIRLIDEGDQISESGLDVTSTAHIRRTIFKNLKEITISAEDMKRIFAEILLEKATEQIDALNLGRHQIDFKSAHFVTYLSDLKCKKARIKFLECKYEAAVDFTAETL